MLVIFSIVSVYNQKEKQYMIFNLKKKKKNKLGSAFFLCSLKKKLRKYIFS